MPVKVTRKALMMDGPHLSEVIPVGPALYRVEVPLVQIFGPIRDLIDQQAFEEELQDAKSSNGG